MPEPLLEVDNLSVSYLTDAADIGAVDRVSLTLHAGEFLGIVGESGCGKSVTALSIMGLIPQPPGRIAGERNNFGNRARPRWCGPGYGRDRRSWE